MRKVLQKIIPEEKIEDLISISQIETVKANGYFLREGEVPRKFALALENSEILKIPYEKWVLLLETDIFWLKLLLGSVEKGFIIKEKRERDLLLLNAETRYLNFMREYPGMDKRISQTIYQEK